MCSDLKVRISIARSDVSVQKWRVGNRNNLHQVPNSANPGCWRVQMVAPYGTFTLTAFCMAVWPNLRGRVVPKRGLGDTHGLACPKTAPIRITGKSPLVVRATVNRRIPSWMRTDNRSDGDGTHTSGNTRVLPCLVQSNNSHAIHIWTTMDFDSKRVPTAQTTFPCSTLVD